ncbi:helix-turn-helix domain-containing protein [Streptomonospora wellingtoniae]|uniref:Helix-turn-helix transcriptional regulator n=1 Tax=Streptomonospora wellingtoniae TaxID=3075544 RepID=A0ABU2KYS1_9ACTN|nr:helix-turn-helix transcriptional regulator [Streptomonospora sp. DSM 45055]MDT0304392.1 helix-turn-helix transcriptional regulator [Streptomonospora sp. DSM 45055]
MSQELHDAARRFGRELARLREISGITQGTLANQLGISSSHISNLERGYRTPKGPVIPKLDKALNAEGRLTRLWEDLTHNGRPVWLDELAELERRAVSILECQTAILPSLLQTEDYARSVMTTLTPWADQEQIEAGVQRRKKRTDWFFTYREPIYWAVIDETVITREVGGPGLMKSQMAHVSDLVESGRISVQLVRGQHPGLRGPFKIISPSTAPDVVYVESARSGQVIDSPDDVRRFRLVYGAIQAAALSPQESAQLILKTVDGLGDR